MWPLAGLPYGRVTKIAEAPDPSARALLLSVAMPMENLGLDVEHFRDIEVV